jgi:tripartite-type tricarboxylate transporter receptor subunit TctC
MSIIVIILSCSTAVAAEKGYPNKPITIINPWPVGGGIDISTRAVAKEMQNLFGVPVLLESRPGAAGIVGGEYLARAKPDGYTIGICSSGVYVPEVYTGVRKPPYMSNDLEPVVRWLNLTFGLASITGMPWNNLNEFIKYVKDNPNKVRYGHSGVAHTMYIKYYALAKQNNLELIEIPFKGAGDMVTALLGGHISVCMTSVASVQAHFKPGRLKTLVIHNPKRMSRYPEIPTFEELGYVTGCPYNENGFFVPKGTPEEVKNKIHDVVKKALEIPWLKAFAEENDFELYYGSASDLKEEIRKEKEVIPPLMEEIAKKQK